MNNRIYSYKIIEPKVYAKSCLKCGRKFTTPSKNKRLCPQCATVIEQENNRRRVNKYNKVHNRSYLGTGRLNGKIQPPHKEIDYVIDEMKYLKLI